MATAHASQTIDSTAGKLATAVTAMGEGFENFYSSNEAAIVHRVAYLLAHQFDFHHSQYRTTARDVRYALMALGAHPMAVIRHSVWIARLIRSMSPGGS